MNCNADEEERRNREISRNIDRQIKLEKNKRQNVSNNNQEGHSLTLVFLKGPSLQSAVAGNRGGGQDHFRQADEDF